MKWIFLWGMKEWTEKYIKLKRAIKLNEKNTKSTEIDFRIYWRIYGEKMNSKY